MRAQLAAMALAAATAIAPLRAEWRAAAYLGAASTRPASLIVDQPAMSTQLRLQPVHFTGRSFEAPVYYGLRLGRFFPRALGAEAEFIHLKAYALTDRQVSATGQWRGAPVNTLAPMNRYVQQFSISHGLNLLVANVAWTPVIHAPSGLRVALRAGAGPTIPHAESAVEGSSRHGYELGRVALHLAGGAELRLWKRLSWISEYKFTATRQRVAIAAGQAVALFRSHHLVFGLGLAF